MKFVDLGDVMSNKRFDSVNSHGIGSKHGVVASVSDGEKATGDRSGIGQASTSAAAKNPGACFFHVIFKIAAFVCYFTGRHFFGDYIVTFILTVVLCAFDFWTVKNVSGRLLVGMRWWNATKADGSSSWYFESHADESTIDPKDKSIFWGAMYTWPLVWFVFLVLNLLSFTWDWLLLIVIAFIFASANVVGYWKCSKEQKRQMSEWAKGQAMRTVVSSFF